MAAAAKKAKDDAPPVVAQWVVADHALFTFGEASMPVRAHNPGDRLLREQAEQFGWLPYVHPLTEGEVLSVDASADGGQPPANLQTSEVIAQQQEAQAAQADASASEGDDSNGG
jgi:hypothetical protein